MPINPQATSCSGPSRVFRICVLQGVTNTPSYLLLLEQLGGTKREALQGHLCYVAHKDEGATSSTEPLSIETAPAFTPWTCSVPSQFTPLRINRHHRGLGLAGLQAISITHLVSPGVNFWLSNHWPQTVRPFPLHWGSTKMQPGKRAGTISSYDSIQRVNSQLHLSLQIQHILRKKFLYESSGGRVIEGEKQKGKKPLILQSCTLPLSWQRSAETQKCLNHITQIPRILYEVE